MTIPKPEHCVKRHSVQFLDVSNIDNSDSDMFKLAHIPGTNLLVVGFTDFNSSSVTFAEQSKSSNNEGKFSIFKALTPDIPADVSTTSFDDYQDEIFVEVRKILKNAEAKVKDLAEEAKDAYHLFHIPENDQKLDKFVETLFESDYEENKHKEKIRYGLDRTNDWHITEDTLNYDPQKLLTDTPDENTTLYYYNAKCHWGIPEEVNSANDWCYVGTSFKGDEFSTASAVHIPLDVYKRDSVTLKDVIWTQMMD